MLQKRGWKLHFYVAHCVVTFQSLQDTIPWNTITQDEVASDSLSPATSSGTPMFKKEIQWASHTTVSWPRNGCKNDLEITPGLLVLRARNRKPRPRLTRAPLGWTIEDEKCLQVRWLTSFVLPFRRSVRSQTTWKHGSVLPCVKGPGCCCCCCCVWSCGGCFHGKLWVPC